MIIPTITKAPLNISHEIFKKQYDASFLTDSFDQIPKDISGSEISNEKINVAVATDNDIVNDEDAHPYYTPEGIDGWKLRVTVTPGTDKTNLDNYEITTNALKAQITQKQLNVIPADKSYVYDTKPHSLLASEITYDSLLVNHYVDVENGIEWENNSRTEVGSTTVGIKSIKIVSGTIEDGTRKDVTKNYKIVSSTATLSITKLKMTIDIFGSNAGCNEPA